MKRGAGTTIRRKAWTPQAVRALGVRTDVKTCASVLDVSERTAYEMVRNGTFPVPVLKLGARYVVPVQPLLELLGIGEDTTPTTSGRPALAVVPSQPEVA